MLDANPNQLSTLDEAEKMLDKLSQFDWPAGHAPVSVDLPDWDDHEPELTDGDSHPFSILFQTGQELNVGLIRARMQDYPVTWKDQILYEVSAYKP